MNLNNRIKTDLAVNNKPKNTLQENTTNYIKLGFKGIILLISIALGLINTDFFYDPTTFSYYGFCFASLLFVITPAYLYLPNYKLITLKLPILLLGLWCLYVLFHYLNSTGTLVFTIYSIALYFLLLKATSLFSSPSFHFKLFLIGIAGISSLQSIYCITQYFGWFKSQHKLFAVTGTWNNPNVTAIFLAMTIPVFLCLFKEKYRKLVWTGFLSLLVSLLLLKCRAAFIGAVLSIIVFYTLEYDFIAWAKNKKNSASVKALLVLGFLIIVPLSSHLYDAKKASADGRKFIWKLSAQMATEKPVTGYGYGYFEKEYNLYQANYIKAGKATSEELANAGPVIMPHNELLYNAVEGGSIGLVLMVAFFGSLLFTIKRKNKLTATEFSKFDNSLFHLSYAGVVSFIGMSMVNSTIQIVPIMCVLLIYAALICSRIESIQLPSTLLFLETKVVSILSKTTIIAISLYLLYMLFGMATADIQNKKAKLLKETRNYEQALQLLPDLKTYLKEDSDYWKNYGVLHYKAQNFQEAILCFKKAQALSSLPDLYIGAGKCYEKLQQYPKAIQEYETLVALYPPKFLYRMTLLEAYLKNKDKTKAITLAQEIIQLKPKIPSEKVNQYKNTCRVLLKKLRVKNTKNFNSNDNNNL